MADGFDMLASSIRAKRVSHALFISCPDAGLALDEARRAAALIVCDEPGTIDGLFDNPNYIERDCAQFPTKNIREYVDELLDELHKRPFLERERVVLLKNAHAMSELVENALLKTLEEPSGSTIFILTGNEYGVLPTIRSRCSVIRLGCGTVADAKARLMSLGASEREAELYAHFGGGNSELCEKLFADEDERKQRSDALSMLYEVLSGCLPLTAAGALSKGGSARNALHYMLLYMHDIMIIKQNAGEIMNTDRDELAKIAPRFTIRRINCIIELLCGTLSKLYSKNASAFGAASMEKLFLEISEAE